MCECVHFSVNMYKHLYCNVFGVYANLHTAGVFWSITLHVMWLFRQTNPHAFPLQVAVLLIIKEEPIDFMN